MAIYKEDIADINLETGNIHRSFLRHSIGTQDQHADHFGIRVMRDGEPVDLTGISVQGVFMPPQGSPIAITGDTYTIVEGNVAKVILPQACYNYEGSFTLAIKLIDITDSITGTIRIIDGVVDNTHASGTVAPTGSVPTYQEILAVYDDLVDALADVASYAANFAPEFVQGTANAAGSFVMNDGVLYLLPDGHTAGTTWANTTKTQANVGGQLSDLKSALDDTVDCVQHDLMPYACNGSDAGGGITVVQNGNEITVNGTSSASAAQVATKAILTDHIELWTNSSVPSTAKVYPIKLISGHSYKLKAEIISGTRDAGTGTGLLTFRLVDSSSNKLSFEIGTSDTTGEATFVSTGESVQIRMFIARLMTLTNVVIRIELEDITEAQEINDINSMFEQYKLSDGYNASNTTSANIPRAPFMFPFEKNGAIIQKIKIGIKTAGTISIGIYNGKIAIGEAYDSSKYTLIKTYSVVTGMNEIVLDNPIVTEIGKTLAVYQTTDTSVFGYGSYGQKGNCYYVDSNGDIAKLGYSSNMTITGIGYYNSNVSVFKGKRISIFGDSISTFKGWIPEGNATFYTGSNYGVTSVNDTWWKKTIDALELELLVNNSWSGRAVSSCRDDTTAHATDAGYKEANVIQLKDGDVLPEIIIVKLGINDFNHGAYLGTYDGSTALPTDPTLFTDAYAMMLNLIMTNFPLADVYCCTLMQCEQNNAVTGFPEINTQGESLIEWNEAIRKLAHAFGAKILDHDICGLTYYNLSTYMGDYSSSTHKGLHPNAAGHSLIANQTIHDMDNCIRTRY